MAPGRTPSTVGVWLPRALLIGLRLSTLATLIWAGWALLSTPPAQVYVEATGAQIAAALDRALTTETDQDWMDQTLAADLARTPRDWVAIDSTLAVGTGLGLAPSAPVAANLAAARDEDQGFLAASVNCVACAAGLPDCRLSDGLVCALGVELTPIGDARVLIEQGAVYASGGTIDGLSVTLAGVGLAATAAAVATGGASAPIKGGVAILRIARRAGRLSAGLTAELSRLGRTLVRWDNLPRSPRAALAPGALAQMIHAPTLARASALSADLGRIGAAVPPGHALALLGAIDGAGDARRMSLLASAGGTRTVATLRHLGKTRALRLTSRLGRGGRVLAGLALALAAQAAALCAVLAQAALRRVLARILLR